MPAFTLTDNAKYPNGTTVKAYLKSNWPTPKTPSGAPLGAATAEGVVAAGTLTLELPEGSYWLVGEVGGAYRYETARSATDGNDSLSVVNLGTDWSEGTLLGSRVEVPEAAHKLDIRDGTAAAPAKGGVTASFSRVNTGTIAAETQNFDQNSCVRIGIMGVEGTTTAVRGLIAVAKQFSNSSEKFNDAEPLVALAYVEPAATGRAIPLYAEANVNSTVSRGGQATEFRIQNSTGETHTYETGGPSKTMGLWITGSSKTEPKQNCACAVQIGKGPIGETPFNVAFGVNEHSATGSAFRDDSVAERSLFVTKEHSKAAIAVVAGNQVVIGGSEPQEAAPRLEVIDTVARDPIARFWVNAAANMSGIYAKNSTGTLKLFASNENNAFMTGTAQGDVGASFTPGKTWHVGAAGKTSMLRVQEAKLGLLGAAPVAKAAAIAEPAETLASLKEKVNAIRTALKNIGITE